MTAPVFESLARFDYYAATVHDSAESVAGSLCDAVNAQVRQGAGRHGYSSSSELWTDEEGTVARVFHGGQNGWPHVQISGGHCDQLVPIVRELWPDDHVVSRVDSAVDWDSEDAWNRLLEPCRGLALERGLKIDQQGDWVRGELGRTFYVGGRTSPAFVRLYEKAREIVAHGGRVDASSGRSVNWCRTELELHPVKEGRKRAAFASPDELWGFSPWTRELMLRLCGLDVEAVVMQTHHVSDDERALRAMSRQYGGVLSRLALRLGSWESLGADLGRRVRELE